MAVSATSPRSSRSNSPAGEDPDGFEHIRSPDEVGAVAQQALQTPRDRREAGSQVHFHYVEHENGVNRSDAGTQTDSSDLPQDERRDPNSFTECDVLGAPPDRDCRVDILSCEPHSSSSLKASSFIVHECDILGGAPPGRDCFGDILRFDPHSYSSSEASDLRLAEAPPLLGPSPRKEGSSNESVDLEKPFYERQIPLAWAAVVVLVVSAAAYALGRFRK